MEIQMIPGYEADEITVVYRRKIEGSKALRVLPIEESRKLLSQRTYRKSGRLKSDGTLRCRHCEEEGFSSRRSLGQHERQCPKNPNKSRERQGKAQEKPQDDKPGKCRFCPRNDFKTPKALITHESQCRKNPHAKHWPRRKLEPAKQPAAPPPPTPPVSSQSTKDGVPVDFDPTKPFGPGVYVYHAPGRKIGRIRTIDWNADKVEVGFSDGTHYFTVSGARSMHKEMIARAK